MGFASEVVLLDSGGAEDLLLGSGGNLSEGEKADWNGFSPAGNALAATLCDGANSSLLTEKRRSRDEDLGDADAFAGD